MKEISNKEVREIAENIVDKTNNSTNDYDSVDNIALMLRNVFEKMEIAVEKVKNNSDCKCTDCKCEK